MSVLWILLGALGAHLCPRVVRFACKIRQMSAKIRISISNIWLLELDQVSNYEVQYDDGKMHKFS